MIQSLTKTAAAFSAAALLMFPVHSPQAKGYEKPNIIVMTADDYGKDAANLYNAATEAESFPETAPTPNLQSLADNGVLFKQGWAMPACSPTRGTRTMGKLPSTSGMGWVVGQFTPRFGAAGSPFEGEEFPPTMVDPNDPDLLQRLAKGAGYDTYKLGKWHEVAGSGDPVQDVQDVINSGFDEFYGQLGGAPFAGYGGDSPWIPANNLGVGPTTEFLTSALVSRAIEFINEAEEAGTPFFMALDFPAPHWPYEVAPGPGEQPPTDNQDDWRTLDDVNHGNLIEQVEAAYGGVYPAAGSGAANTAQARAAFKSLIAYMDVQIGRLMEHVDLDNTYVFFVGDNGTQGAGFAPTFNAVEPPHDPAKSKVTLYRNGVEVPFLAAGPHIKRMGRTSKALVTTTDLYATVLEIIGQKQPKATRRDSISFYDALLHGGKGKRKVNAAELFAATATVGGTASGPLNSEGRVVANKRYRLLARPVVNEAGEYVCSEASVQLPETDCLNPDTGIYEKETFLEFYDIKNDPFEDDALIPEEMNNKQYQSFRALCKSLNKISKKATYFQNGKVCKLNGEDLVDTDPVM